MSFEYSLKWVKDTETVQLDLRHSVRKGMQIRAKGENNRFNITFSQDEDLKLNKLPGYLGRLFRTCHPNKAAARSAEDVWIEMPKNMKGRANRSYKVNKIALADKLGISVSELDKHLLKANAQGANKADLVVDPKFISKSLKSAYASASHFQKTLDKIEEIFGYAKKYPVLAQKDLPKEAKNLSSKKITKDTNHKAYAEQLIAQISKFKFCNKKFESSEKRYNKAKSQYDTFVNDHVWWVKAKKRESH